MREYGTNNVVKISGKERIWLKINPKKKKKWCRTIRLGEGSISQCQCFLVHRGYQPTQPSSSPTSWEGVWYIAIRHQFYPAIELYMGVQFIDRHVDSGYFGIYIAYPQHIHLYRHIQPQRYWALFWHFLVTKFTSFWNAHSPTLPYMNKFVYDTSDQSHTLKSPRTLVNASHWCLHGDFRWLTWSQTAADSPVVLFPEASVPLDG